MDSCLMVWHFRPQARAYRFVGHKVKHIIRLLYIMLSTGTGCCTLCFILTIWSSCGLGIARQDSAPLDPQCVSGNIDNTMITLYAYSKGESTVFSAHSASVRSVDFANDGVSMLSASDDKTVKVIGSFS